MRRRIRKTPSASMVVAFTALLLALGGTAVALPGSNSVTSGDIVRGGVGTSDLKNNSGVRTQDIRNGTVRGRDVRNDTLTGADVNESTLGTVPSASSAGSATSATTASFAGLAANVNGFRYARTNANDDSEVTLLDVGGYRLTLVASSVDGCTIVLKNISAGDNGNMDSDENSSSDFDQNDAVEIEVESTGEGEENLDNFYAHNSTNSITGSGGLTRESEIAGNPDCVANVVAFTQ